MAKKKIARKKPAAALEIGRSNWPLTGPYEPGRFRKDRALEFGPGGGLMVLSHVPRDHPIRQVFHTLFLEHGPRALSIESARGGDPEAIRTILRDFVEMVDRGHIAAELPETAEPPAGAMHALTHKANSRRAAMIRDQRAAVLKWVSDGIRTMLENGMGTDNAFGLKSRGGSKRDTKGRIKKYQAALAVLRIHRPNDTEEVKLDAAIKEVSEKHGLSVPVVRRAYHEFIRVSVKKPRTTKQAKVHKRKIL